MDLAGDTCAEKRMTVRKCSFPRKRLSGLAVAVRTRVRKHRSMKGAGRNMINLTACRKIKAVCRKKKLKETSAWRGKHRVCFRCGLRRDLCLPGKCLPFKHNLRKTPYTTFKKRLQVLDKGVARRYGSDPIDGHVAATWAKRTRDEHGAFAAILGLALLAYFGNNLRTFSIVESCFRRSMRWAQLRRTLKTARSGFHALHSPNCPVGEGHKPVPNARAGDKFINDFQAMSQHASWRAMCRQIESGISSFEDFELLRQRMNEVSADIQGALPGYHGILFLDHLIRTKWLPPRYVSSWPVAVNTGTAEGLDKMYGVCESPQIQSERLSELMVHLRHDGALDGRYHHGLIGAGLWWTQRKDYGCYDRTTSSDHHGIIHAALCWTQRRSCSVCQTSGALHQLFTVCEWDKPDEKRKCLICMTKRCIKCRRDLTKGFFSADQWQLPDESRARTCYRCNIKECSWCLQPKGQREFDRHSWQLEGNEAKRICLACTNGPRRHGMWTCANRRCKLRKPIGAFSLARAKHGPTVNGGSRRCNACVERCDTERAEI